MGVDIRLSIFVDLCISLYLRVQFARLFLFLEVVCLRYSTPVRSGSRRVSTPAAASCVLRPVLCPIRSTFWFCLSSCVRQAVIGSPANGGSFESICPENTCIFRETGSGDDP